MGGQLPLPPHRQGPTAGTASAAATGMTHAFVLQPPPGALCPRSPSESHVSPCCLPASRSEDARPLGLRPGHVFPLGPSRGASPPPHTPPANGLGSCPPPCTFWNTSHLAHCEKKHAGGGSWGPPRPRSPSWKLTFHVGFWRIHPRHRGETLCEASASGPQMGMSGQLLSRWPL